MKKHKKETILIAVTIILFIISSYFSKEYSEEISGIIMLKGLSGEMIYTLLMIIAVIIAPFETLPLLPIAVNLWGPNRAALFTILGWSIGSLVAFSLARLYGQKFVCRFIKKCDILEWRSLLPKKNIFWLIVFARFILPVDIISYVVGLFTSLNWFIYLVATILGLIPFAFIFAYGITLPISLQLLIGLIILVIIISNYNTIRNYFKKVIKRNKFV